VSHAANLDVGGSQAQQVVHPDDRVRGTLSICGSRRLHLSATDPVAVTYEAKFPLPSLATETEIVQQVIDLPPGWRTERAYHGFAADLIMEGEVTYRIGPNRKSYKPGDAWMAQAGTVVTEENNTPKRARVFRSYLVRKGATP